jgi:hypothetical protein
VGLLHSRTGWKVLATGKGLNTVSDGGKQGYQGFACALVVNNVERQVGLVSGLLGSWMVMVVLGNGGYIVKLF